MPITLKDKGEKGVPRNRNLIILGVTASIAAHRSLDLIRLLRGKGYEVQVVATEKSLHFFPKETAEVFSGNPVAINAYGLGPQVSHIEWAYLAKAVLIAPASADFIAKMALGLADDLLSTICLATPAPILFAPAMEERMYSHPATQGHLMTLVNRKAIEIPPDHGPLASGRSGTGRMASPETILLSLESFSSSIDPQKNDLTGLTVLISAGPTYEPIDPVRFIGNRSSGKMGYALAETARDRGAKVLLVSGPVALPPPPGIALFPVETAREMKEALDHHFPASDILIMAAAVSDYAVHGTFSKEKKKKDGLPWSLQLTENPDILATLSRQRKPGQTLVGFAAESALHEKDLREKLHRKGVDMLASNNISEPGFGFGSEMNKIDLIDQDGRETEHREGTKKELSDWIIDRIIKYRLEKRSS